MPFLLNFLRSTWQYWASFFAGAVTFNTKDDNTGEQKSVPSWVVVVLGLLVVIFVLYKMKMLSKITALFRKRYRRTRRRVRRMRMPRRRFGRRFSFRRQLRFRRPF